MLKDARSTERDVVVLICKTVGMGGQRLRLFRLCRLAFPSDHHLAKKDSLVRNL